MAQGTEPPLPPKTQSAPAGRDRPDEFARRTRAVAEAPLLREALNAMPGMVMVLNCNRQIVAANQALLRILETTTDGLLAKRPGEALGCLRAHDGPDGCGTNRHCGTCGALGAVQESLVRNAQVVRECRILSRTTEGIVPLDLKVAATPIVVEGERFVVVAIDDISQPKRLEVLQRVFFHDVLNTAGSIAGYAYYLTRKPQALEDVSQRLTLLGNQLVEEIKAQRDLLAAESGDLDVQVKPVDCSRLLEDLRLEYLAHPAAADRALELRSVWHGEICSDPQLLQRILRNMLKNGLEATAKGQTVSLECRDLGDKVLFSVHNPQVMDEDVQLQVFQRSFSTKGHPGRGIGTYSMKLLGERYLGGKVEFVSRCPEGTTFKLTLPKVNLRG